MKKDGTGRGAGVSIERGKRGMGRSPWRHCLGLSPSSPDPTKYTRLHTRCLCLFSFAPSRTAILFRAAAGQGSGRPREMDSRSTNRVGH
jgi:hypothetical protein